jgi:carbonic anhydrase
MKKTLALIILLLVALTACSTPTTESVTDLLPGNDEPSPTDAAAEPAEESAGEEAITCNTADIPAPSEGGVMIRFLNLSGAEMNAAWHDTNQSPSVLTPYFTLENRETYDQETSAGHEWLIRDEHNHTLADYVASADERQCAVIYPHFGYEGEEPQEWAELSDHYETCGMGHEQSPIDLSNAPTTDLENIVFDYTDTTVNMINNGHTIQVNVVEGSQIVISGTYQLKQFHFHAPSEHTVAGEHYPIEMHLVHQDANKKLAVVGIFIVEGAENTAFAPVWDHLSAEEIGIVATGATVHVADLLPTEQTVYRYSGSLTTPPCSEEVIWSVMTTPIEMSAEQIAAFTQLMEGNNRPPQPLIDQGLQLDVTP